MSICPLCNGFIELELKCIKCANRLENGGKVSDYLDPYGHYNDEETIKMGDGFPNTAKNHLCPHLMICHSCGHDHVEFIPESEY